MTTTRAHDSVRPGTAAPRKTVHRGVVAAAGLLFTVPDAERTTCADAAESATVRLRIAAQWVPNAELYALPGGALVLVFPEERNVDCATSPGAALVRAGELLSAAPLAAHELPAAAHGAEGIAWVAGGVVRFVARAELARVDPARWLALDELVFERDAAPLGAPEAELAPAVPAGPARETLFDAHVARDSAGRERRQALGAALAQAQRGGGAPRAALGFRAWLRGLLGWLLARLAPRSADPDEADGTPVHGNARSAASTRSGARSAASARAIARDAARANNGLIARLDRWLRGVLYRSWFGSLLARRHAEYLSQLFELLDAHADDEALRRAIPLAASGKDTEARPALGPPAPRTALRIEPARAAAGSALGLGTDLFQALRQRYEAAFARLDAAGRYAEAAFVLAELLDDAARAVAYLERHGELVLAAEVAEARGLAPGVVVRQWFLARRIERALAYAVQHGCFADAIARLERSHHHEQAAALRLLFAERLASAGRLVGAAQTARTIAPGLALRWLELARESGDFAGVALELELDPARFEPAWQAVARLLAGDAPDELRERAALGRTLLEARVPASLPLAREVARTLLADAHAAGDTSLARTVRDLGTWIGGVFRADLPALPSEKRVPLLGAGPMTHTFASGDAGRVAIHDVAKVGGRWVLALGELGVRVCTAAGKTVAHFDVPAERLVVAHHGPHLLALAPRGDVTRVSQIHLGTRRAQAWTELAIHAAARTFDGEHWAIARPPNGRGDDDDGAESELVVLDTLLDRPAVVQRLPALGLRASEIALHAQSCQLVGRSAHDTAERLRLSLPDWVLRERERCATESERDETVRAERLAVDATGPVARVRFHADAHGAADAASLEPRLYHASARPAGPTGKPGPLPSLACLPRAHWLPGHTDHALAGTHFALALGAAGGEARVFAGSLASGALLLDVTLRRGERACVRFAPPLLLVADGAGRVLAFDVEARRVVHDVRIG